MKSFSLAHRLISGAEFDEMQSKGGGGGENRGKLVRGFRAPLGDGEFP